MTDHIDLTPEALAALQALPPERPVAMMNLLRFRVSAVYPDDHPAASGDLSGAQAYRRYQAESGAVFARVGGRILWSGTPRVMLIGPADEAWDAAFIASYPSIAAFTEMIGDPAYRTALAHRQAALANSRLIAMESRDG